MKNKWTILALIGCFILSSCDRGLEETVESAYVEPLPPIITYKFSRNGQSSVDIFETKLIDIPVNYIYSSYLKQARINNDYNYTTVQKYFIEGIDDASPKNEIATSIFSEPNRLKIQNDIWETIETSAKIGGYGITNFNDIKMRSAKKGQSGYIGYDISDLNIAFVDNKGIAVAETFKGMVIGAIHLDKILYKHLDESILNDQKIRKEHEESLLLPGKNYTELEHHWDLAFGYYSRWRPYAQAEGLLALKDSEQKILEAFSLGRFELGRYRYNEMEKHLKTIREELSKVVAIRAMSLLMGQNTIANLKEDAGYSFSYLSEAYGLIYSLQFTRKADGKVYFTYNEVKKLQEKLLKKEGFWETERLLGNENTEGSLKNIAQEIGKSYGISIDQIRK